MVIDPTKILQFFMTRNFSIKLKIFMKTTNLATQITKNANFEFVNRRKMPDKSRRKNCLIFALFKRQETPILDGKMINHVFGTQKPFFLNFRKCKNFCLSKVLLLNAY